MLSTRASQPLARSAKGIKAINGPRVISKKSCEAGYFCCLSKRIKKGGPSAGLFLRAKMVPTTKNKAMADNPIQ